MARFFTWATPDYLTHPAGIILAEPLTMACWFNTWSVAAGMTLIEIVNWDDHDGWSLQARGNTTNDPIWAFTSDGPLISNAETTAPGFTVNTWRHACGVFAASNDRAAYLDGGNKGTNFDNRIVSPVPDITNIGAQNDDRGPAAQMAGQIAEAAVWNAALTDAEVAILAAGYSPLFVRPQSLVAYWPLVRDQDYDLVGGYGMTPVNTPSVVAHVPIIYPGAVPVGGLPAGGGNGGDGACVGVGAAPRFLEYRDKRGKNPFRQNITLTIPDGTSESSDYVDLEHRWTVVGAYMPAGWTAANLGFCTTYPLVTGSDDPTVPVTGAVWQPVKEPDSADYLEIQVAAGEYTYIETSKLAGGRYLALRSVTDGSAVNQGAERSVILVVRPI